MAPTRRSASRATVWAAASLRSRTDVGPPLRRPVNGGRLRAGPTFLCLVMQNTTGRVPPCFPSRVAHLTCTTAMRRLALLAVFLSMPSVAEAQQVSARALLAFQQYHLGDRTTNGFRQTYD